MRAGVSRRQAAERGRSARRIARLSRRNRSFRNLRRPLLSQGRADLESVRSLATFSNPMDMPDISSRGPVAAAFQTLRSELSECIIGQKLLVDRLLIALLADGHLLVEGAPGLAKTTAIKELSARIEGDFHRIQFTPDLLPADLTGTEIYLPQQA